MMLATIVILILAVLLTSWGITLLVAGELPGLPLAVGGVVLGIAAIVLTTSAARVRRTLDHDTVSRESILEAQRVSQAVRSAILVTMAALAIFGVFRVLAGEWSLLISLLVCAVLYLLARGAGATAKAQAQSIAGMDLST
jgi:hypothetical protein